VDAEKIPYLGIIEYPNLAHVHPVRGFFIPKKLMSEEINILQYATVNFKVKKYLKVTAQQYLYLDSIRVLQANPKYKGWAYASNKYYADMFDMSVRGVQKMTDKMKAMGLLNSGVGSLRQLTQKAFEAMIYQKTTMNKVHPTHEQSSPLGMNKVHPTHEQSSPNNNNDSNKDKERDNSDSDPSFLDRGKTAKAMAQSICFESKEQMLQEISKTEYADYLIQASAKWRGMNEKGKDAFLDEFAGKNATIKEYGGLKETYQTGIKTHMMNSLKYYEPAKEQTASTYAYYYKIGNKEKKHNDRAMWERDKRNFGNGQGYKEISVLV